MVYLIILGVSIPASAYDLAFELLSVRPGNLSSAPTEEVNRRY
jgi:hypothetical protein